MIRRSVLGRAIMPVPHGSVAVVARPRQAAGAWPAFRTTANDDDDDGDVFNDVPPAAAPHWLCLVLGPIFMFKHLKRGNYRNFFWTFGGSILETMFLARFSFMRVGRFLASEKHGPAPTVENFTTPDNICYQQIDTKVETQKLKHKRVEKRRKDSLLTGRETLQLAPDEDEQVPRAAADETR